MASGTSITNTVKEVYSITITENNGYIEIDYHGSGFLYNMVRIMTSLLIKAGEGQISTSEIAEVIEAKDRNRAKHTAPAHGLYLKKVLY